jgi:hypothetical protein
MVLISLGVHGQLWCSHESILYASSNCSGAVSENLLHGSHVCQRCLQFWEKTFTLSSHLCIAEAFRCLHHFTKFYSFVTIYQSDGLKGGRISVSDNADHNTFAVHCGQFKNDWSNSPLLWPQRRFQIIISPSLRVSRHLTDRSVRVPIQNTCPPYAYLSWEATERPQTANYNRGLLLTCLMCWCAFMLNGASTQ